MASKTRELAIKQIWRMIITGSLFFYGTLCLLLSIVCGVLLIIVPMFELENEDWLSEDNHVTVWNMIAYATIGAVCLYLTQASDRTRFWALVIAYSSAVAYGIVTFI